MAKRSVLLMTCWDPKHPEVTQLVDLASRSYSAHLNRYRNSLLTYMEEQTLDWIVLTAGDNILRSQFDDQHFHFSASPFVLPVIPNPAPGSQIMLTRDGECEYRVVSDSGYWHAPPTPLPDFADAEITFRALPKNDMWQLKGQGASVGHGEPPPVGQWNPQSLRSWLTDLRRIKTTYEVASTAVANKRAMGGHGAVRERYLASGESERALYYEWLSATGQISQEEPYNSIIAIGESAATLHYEHKNPCSAGNSLLIDAGATWNGYASDITRTYCRDGNEAFLALIEAVTEVQHKTIEAIEVGLDYEVLHNRSHNMLAEHLIDIGLCHGSAEALVDDGITRAFFPHGLGHSLGVQVHDIGFRDQEPEERNPALRNTRPIENGQVFTIEPGCYFIDELLAPWRADSRINQDKLQSLRPYGGVRIEDNIAVVDGRPLNLTRSPASQVFTALTG